MKLAERKYTTKKGLEELQTLISSLKFSSDINSVKSEGFYARVERDNGKIWGDAYYHSWTNTQAKWWLKNGKLNIISLDCDGKMNAVVKIKEIDQFDFAACVKSLQEVIEKYNQECAKKDAQIEKFLKFCEDFKNND